MNSFTTTVAVSPDQRIPDDERAHARFEYRNYPYTLFGWYNGTDFYDLFGPTRTSRRGYSLGARYEGFFIDENPTELKYSLNLTGYAGLRTLPNAQNILATSSRMLTGIVTLDYNRLSGTIGAVEAEKGLQWKLAAFGTYVPSAFFRKLFGEATIGGLLPIDHSSVWLRNSVGYSFGERSESAANFYFGGFGNNWVDYRSSNRYRQFSSFPGLELNAAGGTNFIKNVLEWDLPPLRFRRLGIPSIYCNWTRLAFFGSSLVTNIDSAKYRSNVLNAGAQINFQLVIFSSFTSTLSCGYAMAWQRDWEAGPEPRKGWGVPQDELMISLKLF
jgi:hypothetical protein